MAKKLSRVISVSALSAALPAASSSSQPFLASLSSSIAHTPPRPFFSLPTASASLPSCRAAARHELDSAGCRPLPAASSPFPSAPAPPLVNFGDDRLVLYGHIHALVLSPHPYLPRRYPCPTPLLPSLVLRRELDRPPPASPGGAVLEAPVYVFAGVRG
ncbi:hypothetical protein JCM8097_009406 [Rhodosporidiobolus ruineniae]